MCVYVSSCEMVVAFSSFFNINLVDQGYFRLGVKVCENPPPVFPSPSPSSSSKTSESLSSLSSSLPPLSVDLVSVMSTSSQPTLIPHHHVSPPVLDSFSSTYRTRAFYIRYLNERVAIHEAVLMRVHIPYDGNDVISSKSLYLQVLLYHTPVEIGERVRGQGNESVRRDRMTLVTSSYIELRHVITGVGVSHHLIFPHPFSCSVKMCVFSSLLSVDLLLPPPLSSSLFLNHPISSRSSSPPPSLPSSSSSSSSSLPSPSPSSSSSSSFSSSSSSSTLSMSSSCSSSQLNSLTLPTLTISHSHNSNSKQTLSLSSTSPSSPHFLSLLFLSEPKMFPNSNQTMSGDDVMLSIDDDDFHFHTSSPLSSLPLSPSSSSSTSSSSSSSSSSLSLSPPSPPASFKKGIVSPFLAKRRNDSSSSSSSSSSSTRISSPSLPPPSLLTMSLDTKAIGCTENTENIHIHSPLHPPVLLESESHNQECLAVNDDNIGYVCDNLDFTLESHDSISVFQCSPPLFSPLFSPPSPSRLVIGQRILKNLSHNGQASIPVNKEILSNQESQEREEEGEDREERESENVKGSKGKDSPIFLSPEYSREFKEEKNGERENVWSCDVANEYTFGESEGEEEEEEEEQEQEQEKSTNVIYSIVVDFKTLTKKFRCVYHKKGVVLQGILSLDLKHFSFRSLFNTSFEINTFDIKKISKQKVLKVIPNAIEILLKNEKRFLFTSFLNRNRAFDWMTRLLQHIHGSDFTWDDNDNSDILSADVSTHSLTPIHFTSRASHCYSYSHTYIPPLSPPLSSFLSSPLSPSLPLSPSPSSSFTPIFLSSHVSPQISAERVREVVMEMYDVFVENENKIRKRIEEAATYLTISQFKYFSDNLGDDTSASSLPTFNITNLLDLEVSERNTNTVPKISLPSSPDPFSSPTLTVSMLLKIRSAFCDAIAAFSSRINQKWSLFLCVFCTVEEKWIAQLLEETKKKRREKWEEVRAIGKDEIWNENGDVITLDLEERIAKESFFVKMRSRQLQDDISQFGEFFCHLSASHRIPSLYQQRICSLSHPSSSCPCLSSLSSLSPSLSSLHVTSGSEQMKKYLPHPCRLHKHSTHTPGTHLIVFVHGLMGTRRDLRLWRQILAASVTCDTEYLISSSLESTSHMSIPDQAEKLVTEIVKFITSNELHIHRLSFVAHSLGGLIVRSSLSSPLFSSFLPLLHTFVSLAVPHVGVTYGLKRETKGPIGYLAPSAMWLYQKWTQSMSIQQLRAMDSADQRNSFLYSLAKDDKMSYFENVFLIGSDQDVYVPSPSSLLHLNVPQNMKDDVISEMIQSIFGKLIHQKKNVWRIEIETPLDKDWMKGRTAHINLLELSVFVEMFVDLYGSHFL